MKLKEYLWCNEIDKFVEILKILKCYCMSDVIKEIWYYKDEECEFVLI